MDTPNTNTELMSIEKVLSWKKINKLFIFKQTQTFSFKIESNLSSQDLFFMGLIKRKICLRSKQDLKNIECKKILPITVHMI